MLTHNRVLFPCAKQLLETVDAAPEKPKGFSEGTRKLLEQPNTQLFQDYLASLSHFADWGIPQQEILTRFMELDEWRWTDGEPELAQR